MRENLRPGEKFPDIELPNQDGVLTKLSSLSGRMRSSCLLEELTAAQQRRPHC